MQTLTSQQVVQSLVNAYCSQQNANLREKHVFEQNLHCLVRLAKSEQMMELKANVRKLTGPLPVMKLSPSASKARAAALAQMALPGLEEKLHAPNAGGPPGQRGN